MLQRQHVPLVEAEKLEERSQNQLADRQRDADQEKHHAQRKGQPAPRTEIDQPRRIALSGHGLEALAAQQPPLPQHQKEHQRHDGEAQGGGELVIGDRLVMN
jgi:hypothetical protein